MLPPQKHEISSNQIMISQLLLPHPQLSLQELPQELPPKKPLPLPKQDKRMIIHNQLQELPPKELERLLPHPQELLLLLHPQFAADKSLIEISSKDFVLWFILCRYGCHCFAFFIKI